MKKLFLALTLLFSSLGWGQTFIGNNPDHGPVLPTTCSQSSGQTFFLTTTQGANTPGLYVCNASNAFVPSGAAAGSFNVLPSVVSVGSVGSAGAGATLTLTPPASIVNGNCLLAFVSADSINPTWTGPAGFNTQLSFSPLSSSANHILNLAVFSKIASSESGNYVFTISSPSGGELILVGFVAQFTGTACALDGNGTTTGNVSTQTVNGFSTTNSNDLILILARQHETGAGVAFLSKPLNAIKQLQSNNMALYTLGNGSGNTQTSTVRYAQSGGAPNTTDDSIMVVFALAPSTTNTTTPFVGQTQTATLDSLHTTNGIQSDANISTNAQVAIQNGGGCNTLTSPALVFNNTGGVPNINICANSSGNLFIDGNRVLNQVTIGSGAHGGPTLLLGNGSIDFITQDATQDEAITTTDVQNNLYYGSFTSADTESLDNFYNVRTGQFHHFTVGTGVYGGPGDIFALGASGLVGGVPIVAITTPGAPTVTPTCPNGTCASTWGYKIFCTDSNAGGTPASAEATTAVNAATLDGTHFNTITWASTAGCKNYKVFRSTVATSPATTGIIGTVTTGSASNVAKPFSFVDNNIAGDSSTAPATNTTGTLALGGTSGAIKNAAGTATMGLTLKKGSGAGNYTTASTTYVVADSTNLCFSVLIPSGWKLGIQASGGLGTATAVVQANAALTDNAVCSTANAGVLTEAVTFGNAAGNTESFSLNWVITGDGATHAVALQFKTSNAGDSATLLNSSATLLPTITYTLIPSN